MFRSIIGASARYRLLVIAAAGVLLAIGITGMRRATIEAFPDFGPVRVEIQTEALGLSPEEAENLITNPMEQEFFTGIPWLHKIRSNSAPGLSSVEMIFAPGTNDIRARQVVQERLTMVPALPAVSKPPFVIQPVATTSRLLMIGMSSKEVSLMDMSTLARWKIRQRLLSIPGVSNVAIWGLRDRQLQVLIDPHRLRVNGLTVDDVIKTAANAMWSSPLTYVESSTPGTGGFIDTAHQRISINHTQPIKNAKDLGRVTVESDSPKPVLLAEVADLVDGHQLLIGDAVVEGGAGLMLVVERFPGSSISALTANVERALDAMRPGLTGITLDTSVFRATAYVEAMRKNLIGSLGTGLLLLVIVIGAFTLNWRVSLISLVSIVLSLVVARLILAWYGAMLNMMIVAGLVLALAIVIDDAIVGVDNIRRRLARLRAAGGGGPTTTRDTVIEGSREIAGSLATALVIVAISVAPVMVLGEVTGDFVKPLVYTYGLTVLVSMLVAITVTPALAAALLTGASGPERESPVTRRLANGYPNQLRRVCEKPVWALVVAAFVLLGGLLALSQMVRPNLNLVPALKDRDIVVRMQGAPGTSLPAMTRIATQASNDLRAIPGVRSVGAHIGRASNSDLVSNVDAADLWVGIAGDADYDATFAAIEKSVKSNPSVRADVTAYPNLRVREVAAGAGTEDLVVRVYGRNYEVLLAKADTVAKTIADVPGVVAPRVVPPVTEPTVEIEVNVDKASAKGVKPGDVRRAAATMLSSITAGNLFDQQKIFDVVVWGIPSKRGSMSSILDTLVDAPNDSQVRLGDVADVRIRPNPSVIKHDAVSRYVDVISPVKGASLGDVTDAVEARLKKISFPSEHHVEVMGEAAERERIIDALELSALAALIALFFVLQARFDSWRLGALMFVLLLVPLAGAALGAATQGARISMLSLFGGLAVLAYAARHGILLIDGCRRLQREERLPFGSELVTRAAHDRFDAMMLSTVAVIVALVPLLIWGTVAGLEIVKPMAAMVIGGVLVSALVNLFVLPALYLRYAPQDVPVPITPPVQPASR